MLLLAIIGGSVLLMTRDYAGRHDRYVTDIPDKCKSNRFQVHMFRASDYRDAYLCFVEGYFVVSIWNFTKEAIEKWGDDEVTSFSRPSARTMDEVIQYMESTGNSVAPWRLSGVGFRRLRRAKALAQFRRKALRALFAC